LLFCALEILLLTYLLTYCDDCICNSFPWHKSTLHSTLQSSSAINISDTIPVVPAALPFFIILKAYKISYPNQFTGSLYFITGCGIVPCVLIQQSFRILSPFFLHLIISLPTLFHLHLSHNLLLLHPAWILPFALQPCRPALIHLFYLFNLFVKQMALDILRHSTL